MTLTLLEENPIALRDAFLFQILLIIAIIHVTYVHSIQYVQQGGVLIHALSLCFVNATATTHVR